MMLRFFKFKPPKPELPKLQVAAGEPLTRRSPPSSLLRDISGSGEVPDHAPARQPSSQELNVGARLADAKHDAIDAATRLAALVDRETAVSLRFLVEDLESRVCRIAFVGQMNAGKSSLINVLVEQAGLLPADINPWTTVITRLHFAVHGKPTSGASFRFFSLNEWRRLAAGGRTRELTERIFPEFNWDNLEEQVAIMRKRAEQKLGSRLETLLGTEQCYSTLTPGLLNRYVGAGLPDEASGTPSSGGEFSDITKTADVFFDLGAFSFPTILIDTPGVNDPFLVRDEITRQSLQAADVCVIVVTARQPLSSADLGLLRLLRSLDKKRLIIFCNKVDEIDNSEEVLRAITHRISAILKQEFPSANIPIIFGSAYWGRQALAANAQSQTELERTTELAKSSGFDWPSQAEIAVGICADSLFTKSGLPSLAVAISEMMQAGLVADAIENVRKLVDAVCWNLKACLETEIQILSNADQAREGATALIALKDALAARFDSLPERLAAMRSQELAKLRSKLDGTVSACVAEATSCPDRKITCALASQLGMRLRIDLENEFLKAFEEATQVIAGSLSDFLWEVSSLIDGSGLIQGLAIDVACKGVLSKHPSLAALGEPSAIELATSFAEPLFERLPQEAQGKYLAQAVTADFDPILVKLANEAEGSLSHIADTVTEQMRMLTLRPLGSAILRISAALAEAENSGTSQALTFAQDDARETIAHFKEIMRSDVIEVSRDS
jgi:GTP-binding protein EngB required for normal cell division